MVIALTKESFDGEKRVGLTPDSIKKLTGAGFTLQVQAGAGSPADFTDKEYEANGAAIKADFAQAVSGADVVVKVRPPSKEEFAMLPEGCSLLGMLDPVYHKDLFPDYQAKKVTSFAMEFIPRSSLAQSMDVLSSMATVAGYKAVVLAADECSRFFPMFMTAAGTIPPAKVLILGAGVAGLQAIATARRLGAVVEAFDLRPEVKEQVESLGGKFVEMEITDDMRDEQGYAKMASPEFIAKEMELIEKHLSKSDVCISTAQVFGRKAPTLIEEKMVSSMKPGSVIVDLAVEHGGNCEISKPGETIIRDDVKVIGPVNIASGLPNHASKMYSKNIENFLLHFTTEGKLNFPDDDEIVERTKLTANGELVNELVKKFIN